MWKKWFCSVCFSWGKGEPCEVHDPVKHPYARATTPDQLIAGAIIASFAKDFDDWDVVIPIFPPITRKHRGDRHWREDVRTVSLGNSKKALSIRIEFEFHQTYRRENYYKRKVKLAIVNGLPFEHQTAVDIFNAYVRLKEKIAEAQRVAAEAKKKMEQDEKKWNLAEKLLGLERDTNGALRPKQIAVVERLTNEL